MHFKINILTAFVPARLAITHRSQLAMQSLKTLSSGKVVEHKCALFKSVLCC